jgi:phage protein D
VEPRSVEIGLTYDHETVSSDIARFLLSFTYTDNASGKADDLQITLEDREQIWANDWVPEKGDTISATLTAKNFAREGSRETIDCGFFEVDELEYAAPPKVVNIRGVSAAISTALRGEENTRAWEAITLKTIAQGMADAAEMGMQYLAEYNPYYKRRDQTEQSDLAFLLECCEKAGLALKITNDMIVIFDEEQMETQDPVAVLEKGKSNIISVRFKTKNRDIYRACEIKYKDPTTGQTIRHIYEPPNAPETGQLLKINERVEDAEEGKILARKRLREKNLKENMASFTVVGDPKLVAGAVVTVSGYGFFDGNYYIETAKHAYSNSGYVVDIDCHKTMQSYFINTATTIVTERKARKRTRKRRLKWYEK